jgi:hypothetical protein
MKLSQIAIGKRIWRGGRMTQKTDISAQSAQIMVDLDVEHGQLLIDLPAGVELKRAKQIFWRIGYELAHCKDKDVQDIGIEIEKILLVQTRV